LDMIKSFQYYISNAKIKYKKDIMHKLIDS